MLTKEERETIINFNEAESTAWVEVPVGTKFHKRLVKLGLNTRDRRSYAGRVEFEEFMLPKEWIRINPCRNLTVEQRAKKAQIAAINFSSKREG